MATSSTSQSALRSGAAKDDVVGQDGDFTFTINELLANDPGGAAKVDLGSQFFFGSSAADQSDQAKYLLDHGLEKISDADGGTYRITDHALDFDYFVQIGNKGTWSRAHVDVVDRPDAPVDTHHAGELLFSEDFDSYATGDNLSHGSWTEANLGNGPADGP